MKSRFTSTALVRTAAFATLLFGASRLFAGPPLICHPYEIGAAKTLPGAGEHWLGIDKSYDRRNVVQDTLGLLTPQTPILARMETLRRAAIYATGEMRGWEKGAYTDEDRMLSLGLLSALRERTRTATGTSLGLALFDAGFFAETLRQTNLDPALDGYELLQKARELRGDDPAVEFALALASSSTKSIHREDRDQHIARARAGAKSNTLLAANLDTHFGKS